MNYDEIKLAWNAQADDGNRWHSLSEVEKIEWAAQAAADKEREECAKVCDELVGASACARQIRARGEAHFAASKAQHEPLDEEAIERVTGVKRGTPMFLAATGFVRSTERAHGITQEKQE